MNKTIGHSMNLNYSVNLYKNVKNPFVGQTITIENWFDLIKSSSNTKDILLARNNTNQYDDIKKSLSAITYNFLFTEKKQNSSILSPTGLLYIDVDVKNNQNTSFDINKIDHSKVLAYYHSFGGKGYSIVVKVDNLNMNNFDATYTSICNELNIPFDKGAKKPTQYSVLSYDPDIFINYDSTVFKSTEICSHHLVKRKEVYRDEGNIQNKSAELSKKSFKPSRYNNISDFEFNGKSYLFHVDKFDIIEAKFPTQIPTGKRNTILVSYCTNFVWLNPDKQLEEVYFIISAINKNYCHDPLAQNEIKKIVDSVFNYKKQGKLIPTPTKRTIIFNPELTTEEKKSLNILTLAERKMDRSLNKVHTIIADWDFELHGRITTYSIRKYHKISPKTVTKYWNRVDHHIKRLNEEFEQYGKVAPESQYEIFYEYDLTNFDLINIEEINELNR